MYFAAEAAQRTTLQHPKYQPKHQPSPQSLRDVCCQSVILTDFVPGKVYQLCLSLVSFLKHCILPLPVAMLIGNVNYRRREAHFSLLKLLKNPAALRDFTLGFISEKAVAGGKD